MYMPNIILVLKEFNAMYRTSGYLLYLQQSTTGSYPEPNESIHHPHSLIL